MLIDLYWVPLVLIAIVVLLIKKQTRKNTLKVLLVLLSLLFILFVTYHIGMCFFKEKFSIFFPCTIIVIFLLSLCYMAIKYLIKNITLYKFGHRTTGEIIDIAYGRGSNYKIRYYVDNEEYQCIGERLKDKWKVGDCVTVIYSQKEPKNSCLEKEDLKAAIVMTIFSSILLIGAIVIECYALMAV